MSLSSVLITVISLAISACGYLKNETGDTESKLIEEENKGCVQGVVVDGISGKRLAITAGDSNNSVEVIVRNKILSSSTHINGHDENAPERLRGEYFICGIPMDNDFPIVTRAEGFQDFESIVHIRSTRAQLTSGSQAEDIGISHPTQIGNIVLYPLGTEAQDLRFQLLYDGKPLMGATVQLSGTAENTVTSDRYSVDTHQLSLAPQIRMGSSRAESDKNGNVVFPGDKLVLGGQYDYVVIPPEQGIKADIQKGKITVGYRTKSTSLTQDTYVKIISLVDASPKLALVHSSFADETSFNSEGKAVFWFNQEVELTPGSVDSYSASLSGRDQAKLFAEGTNESVKVEISGNQVTLTPIWLKKPNAAELGLKVSFSGLIFRPKGSSLQSRYFEMPNFSINVFDR